MRKLFLLTAIAFAATAQTAVTRIEVRPDPSSTDLRPGESAVVQVRVYGEITTKDSEGKESKRSGRLQDQKFTIKVSDNDGGWLSKPFKFQGSDTEGFISDNSGGGMFSQILKSATGNFISKDTYLYTAPSKPGKYTLEATGSNIAGKVEFNVSESAVSRKAAEKSTFDESEPRSASETKNEFYRKLAERYAPFVAQETWFDPKADIIARFDYDKDWNGANNWKNLGEGSSQAYVYYAVVETRTHWFLHYNFFHPRDYSDNCVAGMCHENDNEGIILTVKKGEGEFGKVIVMETLAHNNVYSYTNDSRIGKGAHTVEGPIAFHEETHPMVFIEAGGHGVLSATDKKSFFSTTSMDWKQNTGMTFVYKGKAERATTATAKDVGYELLPIYDHWWMKMTPEWKENTFDSFYQYKPFGGRPAGKALQYSGAFYGREKASNKARPFWGWFDTATQKKKILAPGQWALDPAYAVTRNLKFPAGEEFSLDYVYNPYLGIEP